LKTTSTVLNEGQSAFLVRQRVARLATADASGSPHAVPVCFAFSGTSLYIALDEKPKNVPASWLKRLTTISDCRGIAASSRMSSR